MQQDPGRDDGLQPTETTPDHLYAWFTITPPRQKSAQLRNPAHRLVQRWWRRGWDDGMVMGTLQRLPFVGGQHCAAWHLWLLPRAVG